MTAQAQFNQTSMAQRALQADGILSSISGAVFTLGAGLLSPIVGAESGIVLLFGLLVLAYGISVFILSNRTPVEPRLVTTIISLNVVFIVLCVGLIIADPFTLTTEGKVMLFLLADIVAVLGIWQYVGLRRMG